MALKGVVLRQGYPCNITCPSRHGAAYVAAVGEGLYVEVVAGVVCATSAWVQSVVS